MRAEDVLSATGTGVWRWEDVSGLVTLDAVAASLLGLPAEQVTTTEVLLRACCHVVDYVEMKAAASLALAEGALAEALLRVVTDDGTVVRTVRSRLHPAHKDTGYALVGTLSEVPGPPTASDGGPLDHEASVSGGWRRSREAFLLDAGRALAEATSTAEVLRVTASLSMPGFTPNGMVVFGVEGERLLVIGQHGYASEDEASFDHMPLHTPYPAVEVVRTGRPVYISNPEEYRRRFPGTWPLARFLGRQSWAFLPLTVAGRTIGSWLAAFSHPVTFTPDERAVLATVARMLGQALSRAHVHDSERALSEDLQRTMLPTHKLEIPGMVVAARYVPTGGGLQVGGDWYDVIPLPSGRTALVIGDVQGHDVRAAAVMSQLRIALRAYASEGHHPDAVLSRASRFLAGLAASSPDGDPTDDRFATCLYVEVDPDSGTLDIARAGHPDPAIRFADGTLLVRSTAGGPPLGIDPDCDYPTSTRILYPGETLLLCTDGLIETGGHNADTGWARLAAVSRRAVISQEAGAGPTGGALAGARAAARARADGKAGGTAGAGLGVEAGAGAGLGVGPGVGPGVGAGAGAGAGLGVRAGVATYATAPGTDPLAPLEQLADAFIQAVHGPPSHRTTGPLADRREDDIALLLLRRSEAAPEEEVAARRAVFSIGQDEPALVADARHQLQQVLGDWGNEEQSDGAVLLLSELLTNVLVHTDSDALLVAELTGEIGHRRLRVEVADDSDEPPHRRSPGELASSGRGLMLLELLAGRWGVDPRGEGKCIWFEMDEDAPPPGCE